MHVRYDLGIKTLMNYEELARKFLRLSGKVALFLGVEAHCY
jgi:hypothetical protein